jgi:hypothetical protein
MVEGRVPVKAAQERLGHSRPDISHTGSSTGNRITGYGFGFLSLTTHSRTMPGLPGGRGLPAGSITIFVLPRNPAFYRNSKILHALFIFRARLFFVTSPETCFRFFCRLPISSRHLDTGCRFGRKREANFAAQLLS